MGKGDDHNASAFREQLAGCQPISTPIKACRLNVPRDTWRRAEGGR
jgi:hypothetical protein